jgi:ribosome-binding factor A
MPLNFRTERIEMLLHKTISGILTSKIKNMIISKSSVTITYVNVSKDIRRANIFFSVRNSDLYPIKDIIKSLYKSSSYIKKNIALLCKLRVIPELRYIHDNSMEYGEKISNLLNQ